MLGRVRYLGILIMLLSACSGQVGPSQFEGSTVTVPAGESIVIRGPLKSGILHRAEFQTMACQAAEVNIVLKNHKNTALKLKAVMIQRGSDSRGFYRIKNVYAAGRNHLGSNRFRQNILIEPRGQVKITVLYNPRTVTSIEANDFHTAVLDIVTLEPGVNSRQSISQMIFRGSTRFVRQDTEGVIVRDDNGHPVIENRKIQGCGEEVITPFSVEKITTYLVHNSLENQANRTNIAELDVAEIGNFGFILDQDNGSVALRGDGWPLIVVPLPAESNPPVDFVNVTLEGEDGTFYGGLPGTDIYEEDPGVSAKMTVTGLSLIASPIEIANAKLTTGLASMESDHIPGGLYELNGEALDLNTGKVTLVIAVKLVDDFLERYNLNHSVFAARIELQRLE